MIAKKVYESINEKFTEKGDPIRDMGIGLIPIEEIHKKLQNIYRELQNNHSVFIAEIHTTKKGKLRFSYYPTHTRIVEITLKMLNNYDLIDIIIEDSLEQVHNESDMRMYCQFDLKPGYKNRLNVDLY